MSRLKEKIVGYESINKGRTYSTTIVSIGQELTKNANTIEGTTTLHLKTNFFNYSTSNRTPLFQLDQMFSLSITLNDNKKSKSKLST